LYLYSYCLNMHDVIVNKIKSLVEGARGGFFFLLQ
jgi:hypothetical protein